MLLEMARALKLLKATHIKIGWVIYRVRRKMGTNRCYCCLDFGHMAADCRGQTEASVAEGAATTFRGVCVSRLFGRQLQIGSLREAANEVQAG